MLSGDSLYLAFGSVEASVDSNRFLSIVTGCSDTDVGKEWMFQVT